MTYAYRILAVSLMVAFGLTALTGAGRAQELPQAVVAVVDTQEIRRESLAGQDFSRQVKAIQAAFQAEYNKVSQSLKKQEAELQRQRAILSQEAFQKRRQAFAQKYQKAQQQLQQKRRQINQAINKASNELTRALMPIFQKIAEKTGANIVVERSQIVLPAPELDITDEVIAELDKVLPTIEVDTSAVDVSSNASGSGGSGSQ